MNFQIDNKPEQNIIICFSVKNVAIKIITRDYLQYIYLITLWKKYDTQ